MAIDFITNIIHQFYMRCLLSPVPLVRLQLDACFLGNKLYLSPVCLFLRLMVSLQRTNNVVFREMVVLADGQRFKMLRHFPAIAHDLLRWYLALDGQAA